MEYGPSLLFKMDSEPRFSCYHDTFDPAFFGENKDTRVIHEPSYYEWTPSFVDFLVKKDTKEVCGFSFDFKDDHDFLKYLLRNCDKRTYKLHMPGCKFIKDLLLVIGDKKVNNYNADWGLLTVNWSNLNYFEQIYYHEIYPVDFVYKIENNGDKSFCGLYVRNIFSLFKESMSTIAKPENIIF